MKEETKVPRRQVLPPAGSCPCFRPQRMSRADLCNAANQKYGTIMREGEFVRAMVGNGLMRSRRHFPSTGAPIAPLRLGGIGRERIALAHPAVS
jgi:hypothetical protein